MRVSQVRFAPISGGALGGHFALHVRLGASDDPESVSSEIDATTLSGLIHDAFEQLDLKSRATRGVLFDTRKADIIDSAEMMSLLGTLRDWGLILAAWVGADKRCAWFELLNHITVFVSTQHWPNFKANEIRYVPSGDPWIEPDIYDVNAGASLYVEPEGATAANILAFVSRTLHPWGIIGGLPGVDFPIPKVGS